MYNELYHYNHNHDRLGRFATSPGSSSIKNTSYKSKTIPKGFKFNRVGQADLDVNKAGSLYVSYGKADAARYVKNLGPTPVSKILKQYATTVQHLEAKRDIKLVSNEELAKETGQLMLKDKHLQQKFDNSFYSAVFTGWDGHMTTNEYKNMIDNPSSKNAQNLSYAINSMLADPNYTKEAKIIYDHFRNKGYDAIPDIHDIYSGTSETAMIIINPDAVKMTSKVEITKDVMKDAKAYVKKQGKLKTSDILKF